MRITYTEKVGKTKIKVCLEDGDEFILFEREWNKFKWLEGDDISDDAIAELYDAYLLPKAKLKALNLLKVRDRSYKELIQKLKIEGYPNAVIQKTLEYADSYHYMDDARFARNYIEYRGKRKSCRELKYELSEKGIDLSILGQSGEEIELPDDIKTIASLLAARWGDHPKPDLKDKERMARYLARRGFRVSDIFKVYKDLGI